MNIFRNFLFVLIMIGILTRLSNHFFFKFVPKEMALHLSYIISGIFICAIAVKIAGFDVVISEYVFSFICWYIFDLSKAKD